MQSLNAPHTLKMQMGSTTMVALNKITIKTTDNQTGSGLSPDPHTIPIIKQKNGIYKKHK